MKIYIKTVFIFLVLVGLQSCGDKPAPLPIEKEKLIKILVDVQLAEALIQEEKQDLKDSLSPIYYAQIFKKHNIDKVLFDTTMSQLGHNPPQMEEIYTQVIKIIEKDEEKIR